MTDWIRNAWAWNKRLGYSPVLVTVPTIVWLVLCLWLKIAFGKTIVILISTVASGVPIYYTVVRVRSGGWDQTKPGVIGTVFFAVVLPMVCLIWNAIEASPRNPDTKGAQSLQKTVAAATFVGSDQDLKDKLKLGMKNFDWLENNKVEETFVLNEANGRYEPEWLYLPIPPKLGHFEYDIAGRPPGHTFDIVGVSADGKVQMEHLYYTGDSFQNRDCAFHKLRMKWQHSKREKEVKLSITLKNCKAYPSQRPVKYLLGRSYLGSPKELIVLDIPADLVLRDICLCPSPKEDEMAWLAAFDAPKSKEGDFETFPDRLIPSEGLKVSLNHPKGVEPLEVWGKENVPMDLRFRAIELQKERAKKDAKEKIVLKTDDGIPWGALYYQVGTEARKLLSAPLVLSGAGCAGKKVVVGINLHSLSENPALQVKQRAAVYVAITAY